LRRTYAVGLAIASFVLGVLLTLGLQWGTSGGASLPPAPSVAAPNPSHSTLGLPDPERTPGAINPAATQDNLATTVCMSGWAATVRPPSSYTSALKMVQIVEYGYADRDPSHYQEDHLVPLELGGAGRDVRNLWPQPNETVLQDGSTVGSEDKDVLENALHAEVCDGSLSLAEAQLMIARDWVSAWRALGDGGVSDG
jgi:hypothetical protein